MLNSETPSKESNHTGFRFASPLDRMAALIADSVFFLPVLALVLSPLKRQALEAEVIGHHETWVRLMIFGAATSYLAVVLYQTLFLTWRGATPGKMLLGLRVQSIHGPRGPRAMEAFLRSFVWCVDLVTLLPLVACFANERRRPLHDRVADTIVVAVRAPALGRVTGAPSLAEMSVASGAQAAVLTAFALVLLSQVLHPTSLSPDAEKSVSTDDDARLCSSVTEANEEWSEGPSRLSNAVSLFAAGTINEDCLRQEADYGLWSPTNSSQGLSQSSSVNAPNEAALGYFAKGLTETDEAQREAYFDKACPTSGQIQPKGKSPACSALSFYLSEVTRFDVDPNDEDTKADLAELDANASRAVFDVQIDSPDYLKIWAVRHLMNARDYASAMGVVNKISSQRALGPFIAQTRAEAHWQMGNFEASRVTFQTAMNLIEDKPRFEFARWFCARETAGGSCSEESRSPCASFLEVADHRPDLIQSGPAAGTFVRAEICRARNSLTKQWAGELSDKISDESGREYITDIAKLSSGSRKEKSEALKSLRALASDSQADDPFSVEANLKLVDLARSSSELEPVRVHWLTLEIGSDAWREVGTKILGKMNSLSAWNEAFALGEKLQTGLIHLNDTQLLKQFAIAAFHSGHVDEAQAVVDRLNPEARADRAPASEDLFRDVVESLRSADQEWKRETKREEK